MMHASTSQAMNPPDILWTPSPAFVEQSHLKRFERWLARERGLSFEEYEAIWAWSVEHPEAFWEGIWRYFDIVSHTPYTRVLTSDRMPGARWFEGATLNYGEHIFRNSTADRPALYAVHESDEPRAVPWHELERQVATLKHYLQEQGVGKGDRVAAYLSNTPEAIVAFLAVNALGAVWSCCSPDFGVKTVIDRFSQIEPVILFAATGYAYSGKTYGRSRDVAAIAEALPSVRRVAVVGGGGRASSVEHSPVKAVDRWEDLMNRPAPEDPLTFTPVPFNHPIWVLYSSGTTGKPKAITHSHGGVLLEHLKYLAFHNDVHPGEQFFWFTTTGWMMWNFLQASMLVGAVPVLYDGSPAHPSLSTLWGLAASLPVHHFGTSAPYLTACMKEQLRPGRDFDLSSLRSIGSTGAPLPPEAFDWVYEAVSRDVWLCSMSGGTDVCTAFVGGCPYKPVIRGRIQCRALGCALKAYDGEGQDVTGRLGEMVIERPMPSMPVYFWNDNANARYRASYFEHYPGVWRHGDWIRLFDDGSLVIQGRSDATLNRKGVRIGTSELYAIVDRYPGVRDSLAINLEQENGEDVMLLFVVTDGASLDEETVAGIKKQLREEGSPRHVPDAILAAPAIPYTLSGKKMEVPVKKILLGMPAADSMNEDAVRNPGALAFFVDHAPEIRTRRM